MSFTSDYLLATANNESPAIYHRWACLSALAVLAGRRFWVNIGRITYYPNFYTVLVGDPGVKKSTAMDMAKDLIRRVGDIPMAATSASKEAITKEMSSDKYLGKKTFFNTNLQLLEEYNQLAIFATELTTFLGIGAENMVDFLTNIYTEKIYDEKYKNAGEAFFVGPYITMLACLTPGSMDRFLKQAIITGGFARRTMFVWGNRGTPVAWPEETEEQKAAMARCVQWGKELQKHSGELKISEADRPRWQAWYNKNHELVKDRKGSTQGYFGTKHEFMAKAMVLMTLSEFGPTARTIPIELLDILEQQFFAPVEENLSRVFEGAGRNPNTQAAAQVVHMLEAMTDPMPRKKIEAMFYDQVTGVSELRDMLTHLINVGRIVERPISIGAFTVSFIGTSKSFQHPDGSPKSNEQIAKLL